ncbi:MAG TPA: hypothetical protein VJQ45_07190 [Ktedonobacterales bacterium]|nr:hypothetical protein [Ktedonobacterales bacterium]
MPTQTGVYPGDSKQPPRRANWWLRLTSSGWDGPQATIEERERVRRSRLASWIILGLLIVALVLVPAALTDMPTLEALIAVIVGILLAAIFNRTGHVTISGSLLVALVIGADFGALLSAKPGLDTIYLPAYDLLAIAVLIGVSVLPRGAAFLIAAVNIAAIVADFTLQTKVGDLAHQLQQEGALSLLARPIALQIIVAAVAYLWVRGTEDAIRRADRAEEIAAMEHAIVEQKRQLDYGIQLILDTHVRAANGDFTARAPLTQENVLWQIAASLNNLLARLQRSGAAEHQLRRTDEEIRRLATAIRDAQQGRTPIWPAPTGTSADLLLELIGRGQSARDPRQPPPLQAPQAPPPYPQPQMGGFAQAGGQAADGGYSQPMPTTYPVPGAGAGSFVGGRVPASGELRWQQQQQHPQPQMPHNPWTSPDEEPS